MTTPNDSTTAPAFITFDLADEMQKAVGVNAVAQWLRMPKERVLSLAEAGQLPGRKVDDRWVFGVASINLWLERKSLEACVRAALERAIESRVVSDTGGIQFQLDRSYTLDELETAYIRFVLKSVDGNKSVAADRLGIDPSTLYRKLARITDT